MLSFVRIRGQHFLKMGKHTCTPEHERAMSIYAFELGRIRFDTLVIEWTKRCPAACDFCFDSHGASRTETVGGEFLARWVREFKRAIPSPDKLAITGGEPFLYYDEILKFMSAIKTIDFSSRSVITNAYWAKSVDHARERIEPLKDLGLTCVNVSCDPSHLKFIPFEHICHLARGSLAAGIAHVAISGNFYVERDVRQYFGNEPDILHSGSVSFVSHPVYPAGRALERKHEIEWMDRVASAPKCPGPREFSVKATGDVAPCCSVLSHDEWLTFGNIYEDDIDTIVRRMTGSFFLKLIATYGFERMAEIARSSSADYCLPECRDSVCGLCHAVLDGGEKTVALMKTLRQFERAYVSHHLLSVFERASA